MTIETMSWREVPLDLYKLPRSSGRYRLEVTIAFALPALSGYQVKGFALTGFVVAGMVLLPAAMLIRVPRYTGITLLLAGLAQLLLLVTNIVNGQAIVTPNSVVPGIFVVQVLTIAVLVARDQLKMCAVLAGAATGSVFWYLHIGTELSRIDFPALWKYGIAVPLTVFSLAVLGAVAPRMAYARATLVFYGVASLVLDFRSHCLICFAAFGLSFLLFRTRSQRPKTIFARGLQSITLVVLAAGVVQLLAFSGIFGSAASDKFEGQEEVNPVPLLSGRTEIPISIAAISTKPLLGWGTTPTVDGPTDTLAVGIADSLGYTDPQSLRSRFWYEGDGQIKAHSILFGSWVEGGTVSFVFIATLFGGCFLVMRLGTGVLASSIGLLLIYLTVQLGWDMLFSPYSYNLVTSLAGFAYATGLALETEGSGTANAQ